MNSSFRNTLKGARRILKSTREVKGVLSDAERKSGEAGLKPEDRSNIALFIDMIKASLSGSYRIRKRSVIYLLAALVYFVNPFDLVPDFILGIGYIDDASVLAFVANKLRMELERFKMTRQIQVLGVDS